MVNKKSNSPLGLKKRESERFTCTMDIFTEILCGRDDEYPDTEEAGYLSTSASKGQKVKIVNLSLGGAKLLVDNHINVGTRLTTCIGTPPNMPSIKGTAKVIWCQSARLESGARVLEYQNYVGIVFQNLRWRQRFRLKKFIKQLSREP